MQVSIDGKSVTNYWKQNVFTPEPIFLKNGGHTVFVEMFETQEEYRFSLQYEGPGVSKQFLRAN